MTKLRMAYLHYVHCVKCYFINHKKNFTFACRKLVKKTETTVSGFVTYFSHWIVVCWIIRHSLLSDLETPGGEAITAQSDCCYE